MTTPKPLGKLIRLFFSEHLGIHKNASPQTISSYRDTFQLLLKFIEEEKGMEPSRVKISDINIPVILAFLNHLETKRKNTVRTRNVRLAAIRSFFRAAAMYEPTCIELAAQIMAIPSKHTVKKLVSYLTKEEIRQILISPDQETFLGLRDYTLLLTLYNTGARVSEIISIQQKQVHLASSCYIRMIGKGRKTRVVPLWGKTKRALNQWLTHLNQKHVTQLLFVNSRGNGLSRHGVEFILKNHAKRAKDEMPTLNGKQISPHVIRHSTAMHLLQSGVDIASIAMWLGHESIETTHSYVETDLKMKRETLANLKSPQTPQPNLYRPKDSLLEYLTRL